MLRDIPSIAGCSSPWIRDLRSGKYADTEQIARHFKLNDAHVRRLLRFCYLAPDIVEAIVEGRQPRCIDRQAVTQRNSPSLA